MRELKARIEADFETYPVAEPADVNSLRQELAKEQKVSGSDRSKVPREADDSHVSKQTYIAKAGALLQ